ncbi:hypothetical protein PR048_005882 [Dryococelus australis]|uniref:Uncharacterized protein n=1 Tax=Dryococelus australis TaxID=614101 RepID=A0ABQ9I9G8_9NEOP|nr:hypothetical protein PR048_005882 [Dryococelus australis]
MYHPGKGKTLDVHLPEVYDKSRHPSPPLSYEEYIAMVLYQLLEGTLEFDRIEKLQKAQFSRDSDRNNLQMNYHHCTKIMHIHPTDQHSSGRELPRDRQSYLDRRNNWGRDRQDNSKGLPARSDGYRLDGERKEREKKQRRRSLPCQPAYSGSFSQENARNNGRNSPPSPRQYDGARENKARTGNNLQDLTHHGQGNSNGKWTDVFGLDKLPLLPVSMPDVTTSAEKTKEDLINFVRRRLFGRREEKQK